MLSQNQEETRSAAAAGLLFMAAPGPSESPAEGADEELSSKRLRLDAPRFDKENVLSPRRAIPDRQVGVLAPIASVIGQHPGLTACHPSFQTQLVTASQRGECHASRDVFPRAS